MFFDRIATEADRQGVSLGGVLILSEKQADWAARVKQRPGSTILTDPPGHFVSMKKLIEAVQTLVPQRHNGAAG